MNTNTNYVFFHHNEKKYLYSRTKNSLFSSSEIAEKYFNKSQDFLDQNEVNLIDLEFENLTKENIDTGTNEIEIYIKISSVTIDSIINDLKNNIYNIDLNYFFIFEFDNNKPEIEKIFTLYSFLKNQNFRIKFLLKEKLNYIFDITTIKRIREIGLEFIFYTNCDSLINFLENYEIKGKIYIELRLDSEEDIVTFNNLYLPNNFFVMLSSTNKNISEKILLLLKEKLEKYLADQSYNISNYIDIIRILKYNFSNNKSKVFQFKNLVSVNNKCQDCWANKICHTTRLFEIYNKNPTVDFLSETNCNDIRKLIIKYFQIKLEFRKDFIQKLSPKIFEKNSFKIKLINP